MMTPAALDLFLREKNASFSLIRQDTPIRTAQDGAKYFPPEKAAPTLVVQTERGLMSLIVSVQRGRLDLESIRAAAGLEKLKLADRKKVFRETGYEAGSIPLVGLDLPCIFDDRLLAFDFVYGGCGDELCTLKITPQDVKRLNPVFFTLTDEKGT